MNHEWNLATTNAEEKSEFDPVFNTFQPTEKPGSNGTSPPRRDFGEKPEAPKPNGKGLSPDTVFDDAYNLLPPKRPDDAKPEGPFDSRFNNLNKPSDFPQFRGRPQAFNQNGEVGKLYVDEKSGLVVGMEFTGGSKKGQKHVFDRDAQGNITKMHMLAPGKQNEQAQYLSFTKSEQGWTSQPAGQAVPGFRNLETRDQKIVGDFKVNNKGDFSYESPDKQTKTVLRLNGDKDYFNMREYSRERESLNGQKNTTFWNGYEWLPGNKQTIAEGVTRVTFQAQRGKPAYMIRDAKNNGFQVEFGAEKTAYKVDNWTQGKMTRVHNGATDTIYSTGAKDAQGKLQWRKGQEKVENGNRIVQFNDAKDAQKVTAGEIPQGSIINQQTGDVTAVYANGTKILSDSYGRTQRITYKDQQHIDVLHDANNEFKGFKRSDGTLVLKGADANLANGPQGGAAWIVQRPGQQPVEFTGVLKHGNAGSFNIMNAGNEGLSVNPDGVLSTKIGGKVVSDTPAAPKPGDTPQVVPPQPGDKPGAKPGDKPGDKPGEKPIGKTNVTDQQLQNLAAKYKMNVRILAQARERAEKQGLHKNFTEQNVDKLLELANKHKLLADFTDKGVSAMSRPGAVVGKLIPELLAAPETAMDTLQTQMKDSLAKSLKDSGAQQPAIDRAKQTVDQRFASLKTNTQPFVTELKTALATRQPEPLPVVPKPDTPVAPKPDTPVTPKPDTPVMPKPVTPVVPKAVTPFVPKPATPFVPKPANPPVPGPK